LLKRHALDRRMPLLEVMHGEQQPAPHEAGCWRSQPGFPEAILQRASLDAAACSDVFDAQRLASVVQVEAEGGEHVGRNGARQDFENSLLDQDTCQLLSTVAQGKRSRLGGRSRSASLPAT
jgi:hypothetical protein